MRFTQLSSPPTLKPLPGAGLALWALSEGHEVVEKVRRLGQGGSPAVGSRGTSRGLGIKTCGSKLGSAHSVSVTFLMRQGSLALLGGCCNVLTSPTYPHTHGQVYSSSVLLDGEAVIVFFRALCAVSREELDASASAPAITAISSSGTPPSRPTETTAAAAAASSSSGAKGGGHHRGGGGARLYSLQRLLDCAAINSGRIRLIRSKLWSMTGSHLVMVACHTSPSVAIYAVNALYGLAQV